MFWIVWGNLDQSFKFMRFYSCFVRVPVGLSQRFVGDFAVAALNGAPPALCGTFPVLGGVWRRPMSEAFPALCGTFRTGGPETHQRPAARFPRIRIFVVRRTPCTPPPAKPQSAHHAATIPLLARTRIVDTRRHRLLFTEKMQTDE